MRHKNSVGSRRSEVAATSESHCFFCGTFQELLETDGKDHRERILDNLWERATTHGRLRRRYEYAATHPWEKFPAQSTE